MLAHSLTKLFHKRWVLKPTRAYITTTATRIPAKIYKNRTPLPSTAEVYSTSMGYLLFSTCMISLLFLALAEETITIKTNCGPLKGTASGESKNVFKFLGVPFAKSVERFEKAELMTRWQGT